MFAKRLQSLFFQSLAGRADRVGAPKLNRSWNLTKPLHAIRGARAGKLVGDADACNSVVATRNLSVEAALSLLPGDDHYRAYIGHPDRFDLMSGSHFSFLFSCGLREQHRVLDFGCGSLRLGRLLIPYLLAGNYFGIDPNRWLIEDGLRYELGTEILSVKRPQFSYNSDFDCGVFGVNFDFIFAFSILSHCGPDLVQRVLGNFKRSLNEKGLILFTYANDESAETPLPQDGWHYPPCVYYQQDFIKASLDAVGLASAPIAWNYQGQKWFAASHAPELLPNLETWWKTISS